jgi:hypothetical protein
VGVFDTFIFWLLVQQGMSILQALADSASLYARSWGVDVSAFRAPSKRELGLAALLAATPILSACPSVDPPPSGPRLSIVSPVSGREYVSPLEVSLEASSPVGIESVRALLDGSEVCSWEGDRSSYECLVPAAAGSRSLEAVAVDAGGARASRFVSFSVVGPSCEVNPAVAYWDLIGGSSGVDVSAIGGDCLIGGDDRWMMDFVHSQQTLGGGRPRMSDDIANMFFARAIVYHTGKEIAGFGANNRIDREERQVVDEYYFGELNPVSGDRSNPGLVVLREEFDDVAWFVSPPGIGILADVVRGLPVTRMPGLILDDLGVSRFESNPASSFWGSFDYDPGPDRVSGLRKYMRFDSCTAVDPRDSPDDESSFDRAVHKQYFEDRGLPVDVPVQKMTPGVSEVYFVAHRLIGHPIYEDKTVALVTVLPESLRHEVLLELYAHNDPVDTFVGGGEFVSSTTLLGYLDRAPPSVLSDIKVFTSTSHTGMEYGGVNPYSDHELLELFAFDEHNPHAYAGFRDPRFNLPLATDAYGNITASEPIFSGECRTKQTTGLPLYWETSISGPLSWFKNN